MKHKMLLRTGALVLGLISCAMVWAASPRTMSGKSPVTIPIELDDNLIYVRVGVNGSRPLSFILDTGAHSIIDEKQARAIGLKLKLMGQAGGIGAKNPDVYLVTRKTSLSLAGVAFSPSKFLALSLGVVESCVNEFVVNEEGRDVAEVKQ